MTTESIIEETGPRIDLSPVSTALTKCEDADPATVVDKFGAAMLKISYAQGLLNEMKDAWEAMLLAYLQKHDCELMIGPVRYYAGIKTSKKVRDVEKAYGFIMEACGGDIKRFTTILASEPFKQGSCKKLFEEAGMLDAWNKCFEVVDKPDLLEGKPVKGLQSIDERFLK